MNPVPKNQKKKGERESEAIRETAGKRNTVYIGAFQGHTPEEVEKVFDISLFSCITASSLSMTAKVEDKEQIDVIGLSDLSLCLRKQESTFAYCLWRRRRPDLCFALINHTRTHTYGRENDSELQPQQTTTTTNVTTWARQKPYRVSVFPSFILEYITRAPPEESRLSLSNISHLLHPSLLPGIVFDFIPAAATQLVQHQHQQQSRRKQQERQFAWTQSKVGDHSYDLSAWCASPSGAFCYFFGLISL